MTIGSALLVVAPPSLYAVVESPSRGRQPARAAVGADSSDAATMDDGG